MKTTINKIESSFIIENGDKTLNTVFDMGKIWLTKKEISEVYGVKKSDIKKELNKVLINSELDLSENIKKIYNPKKAKKDTYYSLDILLILGYSSKHFKETKFLVNTNKFLRDYTSKRRHNTKKIKPLFKKIFDYIKPNHI